MRGYRCDRCDEFTSREKESLNRSETTIQYRYTWYNEARPGEVKSSVEYDLCNDCRTELVDWVEAEDHD